MKSEYRLYLLFLIKYIFAQAVIKQIIYIENILTLQKKISMFFFIISENIGIQHIDNCHDGVGVFLEEKIEKFFPPVLLQK